MTKMSLILSSYIFLFAPNVQIASFILGICQAFPPYATLVFQ